MNTTGLWLIPADSNILADAIKQGGYDGLYRDHVDPAMKAASTRGERVTEIWERFPFSLYGRTVSASLRDFAYNTSRAAEWCQTVRRITMPNLAAPEKRMKYIAYLRPPSDLLGGPVDPALLWRAVLDRLKFSGAKAAIELAGHNFSLKCYAQLDALGLLHAIEPGWEVGLPQLHRVPIVTAQKNLEDEQAKGGWPQNWVPLGSNQPARYLIADDEPWTPQWSRLARATGYRPLVMPHRFVEAGQVAGGGK